MKMRRAARKALAVPLMIGGAVLFLTIGTANVFAASSSVPVTSSGPHEHENVVCSPNPIAAGQPCTITFTDAIHKGEPFKPTKVCFTVNPTTAGTVIGVLHARDAGRLERHRHRHVHRRVPTSAATRTTTRRSSPRSSPTKTTRSTTRRSRLPAPPPRTRVPSFRQAPPRRPGLGGCSPASVWAPRSWPSTHCGSGAGSPLGGSRPVSLSE